MRSDNMAPVRKRFQTLLRRLSFSGASKLYYFTLFIMEIQARLYRRPGVGPDDPSNSNSVKTASTEGGGQTRFFFQHGDMNRRFLQDAQYLFRIFREGSPRTGISQFFQSRGSGNFQFVKQAG